ncbi:MAG: diguanylate cyclase [Leptolyngbya sp.]|nr:MAG: diguanylate cyclase [Leptolyngbya sp.]
MQNFFRQTKQVFLRGLGRFSSEATQRRLPHLRILISLIAVGTGLGIRQLGWLQPLELIWYDSLVQFQPRITSDSRIVVVGITEADIKALDRWPISDQVLAQALTNLQAYNPKVVGLDIYRDIPYGPGHQDLLTQLAADNLIAIKTVGGVEAPASVPAKRVGFNDVVLDTDGFVRRNLMAGTFEGEIVYSFALRLSLIYLDHSADQVSFDDRQIRVGDDTFQLLHRTSGSYQRLDSGGRQVMLRYRPADSIARQLSLSQVLAGDFDPEWIEGKVVLIGAIAESAKDSFLTPLTRLDNGEAVTPGVVIHAHMVSQVLSTVLDNQPSIWVLPDWAEAVWMLVWAVGGCWVSWRVKHPLTLGVFNMVAVSGLILISYGSFLQAGWLPTIAPLTSFALSQALAISYKRLYDSTHDVLTGLVTREDFIRQTARLMTSNENSASHFAVLFLSLNRLNIINESLGFNVGDEVLCIVVNRLRNVLKGRGKIARVGTAEFAIFVYQVKAVKDIQKLADSLNHEIGLPFDLYEKSLFLASSIGISLNQPGQKHCPEDMLRDAHTAMFRAKSQGKSHYEVFAIGMYQEKLVRMQLEADLRHALERQELCLNYQPIISLDTGKIVGFEALVRWHNPQKGFISPGEFIPVAEETGLIVPIGYWIFKTACEQIALWQAQFPAATPLMMSINLSPGQFAQPNLVEQISEILNTTAIQPETIKLEITESMVAENVEAAIGVLLLLKGLGIKLGMDDFGTGYSSLSYLSRFPLDTLKIDRSFVNAMHQVSSDLEVVRTIINLGHNLGMDIIAEGVEHQAQLISLTDLNCEYAQGFWMSKPLARELATDLLLAEPCWRSRG